MGPVKMDCLNVQVIGVNTSYFIIVEREYKPNINIYLNN